MKNQIATGMIALSFIAPATSMASDSELLNLDNLKVLANGQVQCQGNGVKPSVISTDELQTAGIHINYQCQISEVA